MMMPMMEWLLAVRSSIAVVSRCLRYPIIGMGAGGGAWNQHLLWLIVFVMLCFVVGRVLRKDQCELLLASVRVEVLGVMCSRSH